MKRIDCVPACSHKNDVHTVPTTYQYCNKSTSILKVFEIIGGSENINKMCVIKFNIHFFVARTKAHVRKEGPTSR